MDSEKNHPNNSNSSSRISTSHNQRTSFETFDQKLWRKCSEEPLVPIGCGVTTYFLISGIRSFYQGNAGRSQTMMRARVASQGFTILAFVGYAVYDTYLKKQQKLVGLEEDGNRRSNRDEIILNPERRSWK